MPKKRILTVNCEIPGGDGEYADLDSKVSLLDWDIVIFWPELENMVYNQDTYKGKPSLSDDRSFRLRQQCDHWRREIHEAFDAGKMIVVFLTDLTEVYIDTGERQYSGTGRNQKTTRLVALFNNYESLPLNFNPISAHGNEIKLTKNGSLLAGYWSEFGRHSDYRVKFESNVAQPLLVTKTGSKTIGALIRSKNSKGSILLLPHLNLNNESFWKEPKEGEIEWTSEGTKFGKRLVHNLLEVEQAVASSGESTPLPAWASDAIYETSKESELRQKILTIDTKVDNMLKTKAKYADELSSAGRLRGLLYETGTALENSIIEALRLLGFTAENYRDSQSEFDVVFTADEGRFLGESEGRDNKAIAIEKLRQLEMNIHEDFNREEVNEPARGVLFGNAQRLLPVSERGGFFTDKCLLAARRSSTALVRTPDLFRVAQFLEGTHDTDFARECRKAILATTGEIVDFPPLPRNDAEPSIATKLKET